MHQIVSCPIIHHMYFLSFKKDLKLVGTAQLKSNAQTLENKPKNRYNNVLPCE